MKILQFKENVRIKRWTPVLANIIDNLDEIQNRLDWVPELTITSCNDSKHLPTSQHYKDLALDIRSKNFTSNADKLSFVEELIKVLGPKFYVLWEAPQTENEHFHIQLRHDETYP